MHKFRRNLLTRLYRSPEPGDDGSTPITPPAGGAPDAQVTANTGDAAAAAATPADASKPGSMLEAMFGQEAKAPTAAETAEAAAAGKTVQQLRDDKGRFAGKPPTDPAAAADPTKKPEAKPDPNGMPEGLSPKAQERFQTLANTNKELTAKVAEYEPIVQSAQELQATFQQHGVRREQFDQAMQAVGMINRGDLMGALKVLDEQRSLISLALGRPIPGADALANYPDLRNDVDNLQITEEHALELARGRKVQEHQQQQSQREQQQHHTQQQAEQANRAGIQAVDQVCKRLEKSDLDYAAIEPMLLKEIQGGLLRGIPPQAWASLVEKTYGLMKQTAGTVRSQAPAASVLRPTGGESPRQAPKSMHEAMWGAKA